MRKCKQKSQTQEQQKSQDKPKRKKKRRGRKLLFLTVIGGAGALALSEDLRNKALDALFGSEEEFQYSPPSTPPAEAAGDLS